MLNVRFLSSLPALVSCLLIGWSVQSAASSPAQQSISGWFHIIHATSPSGSHPHPVTYALVDEQGGWIELLIDEPVARQLGDLRRFDRQRVTVTVERVVVAPQRMEAAQVRTIQVRDIRPATRLDAHRENVAASPGRPMERRGSFPYVTILCRFADSTSVTPHPRSRYEALMGSAAPGMDHYWREVSDGRIDIGGSTVVGWYDLPQPMAYYFPNGTDRNPDFGRMVMDCTGVADTEVDFSSHWGINLQFNTHMPYSWGGSWTVNRSGQVRQYGVTWMARWAGQHVYAHELGHSLGLPHSSGPYSAVYDSKWDVMSGGGQWEAGEYVSVHTIALHKDALGWIPAERKFVPDPGTSQEVVLERSAQPPAEGYLMAQIPLTSNPDQFYTVETRRAVGYDRGLPTEAVVLHTVSPVTSINIVAARVLDVDGNGDPNDEGARWTPGKTFTDSINGVSVAVTGQTATGYRLRVRRGWRLGIEVTGSGTVTDDAGEIDCAGPCERVYLERDATATLTATPASGWLFLGWSGACGGVELCQVALTQDRSVGALFAQPLVIESNAMLGAARMGARYTHTFRTSGGAGSVTWALGEGTLPEGLSLDPQTGVLSGILTGAGTVSFTLTASSNILSDSRTFHLTVDRPALDARAVLDHLLGGTTLTEDEVRFLDLIGNRNGRLDVGDVRAWLLENQQINPSLIPGLQEILGLPSERRQPPEPDATSTGINQGGEV